MESNYIDCHCSDFGCTLRVNIDPEEGWKSMWLEYRLQHHLSWWRRLWECVRFALGLEPLNWGGTVLTQETARDLRDYLNQFLEEDLEALIDWGHRTVADFEFGYDDFRGNWFASGVYKCDLGGDYPRGDTAVECLKNLKAEYQEWEKQFNRS